MLAKYRLKKRFEFSAKVKPSTTKIATFNVHGLASAAKQDQLLSDIKRYGIGICCLQETKCAAGHDIATKHQRLILIPSKCRHYGLGYAMNSEWTNRLIGYESISDRLAAVRFKLNNWHTLVIMNAYAPTQARANKNADEREEFYDQLDVALQKYDNARHTVIIAGDFNSKIGKKSQQEKCLGEFSRGRRNNNGDRLVEFGEAKPTANH